MKTCSKHKEIERAWPLDADEYDDLPKRLEKLGFRFRRRLLITDFVLPLITTYRTRIVRVWEDDDEYVKFIRCSKADRNEIECKLRWRQARGWVLRGVEYLRSPVPHYHKLRDEYEGVHDDESVTIARDHAVGLGEKSGFNMEVEAVRELPVSDEVVDEIDDRIIDLGHTIIGGERKFKPSYRKLVMSTASVGQQVVCGKALRDLRKQYDDLLPKIRDARSLAKAEQLGARLKRAGDRALRASAA